MPLHRQIRQDVSRPPAVHRKHEGSYTQEYVRVGKILNIHMGMWCSVLQSMKCIAQIFKISINDIPKLWLRIDHKPIADSIVFPTPKLIVLCYQYCPSSYFFSQDHS